MTAGGAVRGLDVLIVEDQAYISTLLRELLQIAFPDCAIAEAGDAKRGLELVRSRKPRLVLMDIVLPDANGINVAAQVKEIAPATQVIMITQLAGQAYEERARAAGAVAYVLKERLQVDVLPLVARALGLPLRPELGGGSSS